MLSLDTRAQKAPSSLAVDLASHEVVPVLNALDALYKYSVNSTYEIRLYLLIRMIASPQQLALF
jgi:hypothetical protein